MRPAPGWCRRCRHSRHAHDHYAGTGRTDCALCPCRRYHRWWPWPRSAYRERDLNDLTGDDVDPGWPATRAAMPGHPGRDLADRLRLQMPGASDDDLAGMLADLRAAARTATEEMLGDLDDAVRELRAPGQAEVPQ